MNYESTILSRLNGHCLTNYELSFLFIADLQLLQALKDKEARNEVIEKSNKDVVK